MESRFADVEPEISLVVRGIFTVTNVFSVYKYSIKKC